MKQAYDKAEFFDILDPFKNVDLWTSNPVR